MPKTPKETLHCMYSLLFAFFFQIIPVCTCEPDILEITKAVIEKHIYSMYQ